VQAPYKTSGGEVVFFTVKVWNRTVSNLTLMVLGLHGPEVLLTFIEIVGNDFKGDVLGPSTVIASAAFNLFMVIGLSVLVIPRGEVRNIKQLSVFFCTACWSIFAFIWMYFILQISSPNIIDVWEAFLTLVFFPLTVFSAYLCDKRFTNLPHLYKAGPTVRQTMLKNNITN
jgi:solute carrier family 8 (sodium/calcium exchanger)